MVSFSDSVSGSSLGFSAAYRGSCDGCRGSSTVSAGGGMSKLRRQILVCASPCFAEVSALFSPCSRAVVALVQPPALRDRNPQLVERIERDSERLDRALQHRRERDVEHVAAVFQQAAGFARFVAAAVGEVDVVSSR